MSDEAQQASTSDAPPTSAKVDPESLVLRARPARAIRFRRSIIIGAAAVGSLGLAVTAWVALRPLALHLAAPVSDETQAAKAPDETLSKLPKSYGDVPQLGPPLPGDLGKAVLDQQRALGGSAANDDTVRADQAAQSEHDRQASEAKSARESALLVQTGNKSEAQISAPTSPAVAAAPIAAATDAAHLTLDPDHDPNAQQRKADFFAARDTGGDVNPHRLTPAASPDMLSAGSVIAASLITGLRSDLPGLVIAQVTERVYDSATGRILLIPQGARLIGSYDSVVAFGQSRALIVWQRIILPNGSSIALDNVPATDPSGYAGLADKVDFHTWALLKGVAVSTVLGVGTNVKFSGQDDLVQAIRESTQQNVSRAGDQITSRNLSIQPTITIRPGAPVRLVVRRDLVLAPWDE